MKKFFIAAMTILGLMSYAHSTEMIFNKDQMMVFIEEKRDDMTRCFLTFGNKERKDYVTIHHNNDYMIMTFPLDFTVHNSDSVAPFHGSIFVINGTGDIVGKYPIVVGINKSIADTPLVHAYIGNDNSIFDMIKNSKNGDQFFVAYMAHTQSEPEVYDFSLTSAKEALGVFGSCVERAIRELENLHG